MDRMTGYEPVDPGSIPGESALCGECNMFSFSFNEMLNENDR